MAPPALLLLLLLTERNILDIERAMQRHPPFKWLFYPTAKYSTVQSRPLNINVLLFSLVKGLL